MTSQCFIDRHEDNEISGQGGNRKLVHIGCQRQSQSVIPVFCGSDKKNCKLTYISTGIGDTSQNVLQSNKHMLLET